MIVCCVYYAGEAASQRGRRCITNRGTPSSLNALLSLPSHLPVRGAWWAFAFGCSSTYYVSCLPLIATWSLCHRTSRPQTCVHIMRLNPDRASTSWSLCDGHDGYIGNVSTNLFVVSLHCGGTFCLHSMIVVSLGFSGFVTRALVASVYLFRHAPADKGGISFAEDDEACRTQPPRAPSHARSVHGQWALRQVLDPLDLSLLLLLLFAGAVHAECCADRCECRARFGRFRNRRHVCCSGERKASSVNPDCGCSLWRI